MREDAYLRVYLSVCVRESVCACLCVLYCRGWLTYRVGDWLPVAGRGPAGTLCSRLMGMEMGGWDACRDSQVGSSRRRGEARRIEWRRSGKRRSNCCCCSTQVGGGHAATMEFECFKRQVGGRSIEALCPQRCDPGREVWALDGEGGDIFLPSSLVAKSGLSPMRI